MKTKIHATAFSGFHWKIPVIAAVYFFGTVVGAALVTNIGMQFPEMPGQTYVPILSFLTALVLAAVLAFLSHGLGGSTTKRWMILLAFMYVAFVINNQIEASVFTVMDQVPTMLLFFILPCALATGTAVQLIKPPRSGSVLSPVFVDRPVTSWWWRVLLAWLSFPVIYYFFGALIYPLVRDIYAQQDSGLHVPNQIVVVSAVAIRSLLFLVVTIPILANWNRSRTSLVFSLAAALAAMVGVAGMFENTWMPLFTKSVHSLEIIADSLVHAWVMVKLLVPKRKEEQAAISTDSAN